MLSDWKQIQFKFFNPEDNSYFIWGPSNIYSDNSYRILAINIEHHSYRA